MEHGSDVQEGLLLGEVRSSCDDFFRRLLMGWKGEVGSKGTGWEEFEVYDVLGMTDSTLLESWRLCKVVEQLANESF